MSAQQSSAESFWGRVEKTADCWLWKGSMSPRGYGRCNVYAVPHLRQAHRVAWVLSGRSLSPGLALHHRCHNRACVNPAHLEAMTLREHGRMHGLGHGRPPGIAAKEVSNMSASDIDPRRRAVELVAQIQRERRTPDGRRLTDAAVAELLGVSQSAWTSTRTGKRQPGTRMMRGMIAAFPETIPLLMSFFLAASNKDSLAL